MEIKDGYEEELRRKAARKLGHFFSNASAEMPDSVVIEQASSAPTAAYAASLIPDGATVADLTAGLGVNTCFFSIKASKVYAVERDAHRAEILSRNLQTDGIDNVSVFNSDCLEWLKSTNLNFDFAFIDPSRRHDNQRRVFMISDCQPDVAEVIPLLKNHCNKLIIKASPLLDITSTVKAIPHISDISIVEVNREVKELLIEVSLKGDKTDASELSPRLRCVILYPGRTTEIIEFGTNASPEPPLISGPDALLPGGYLYEPSPAIMKAANFSFLTASHPEMRKLDANTHLFFSPLPAEDLPGRLFRIEGVVSSRDLKSMRGSAFGVISRNHPLRPSELTARYKFHSSDEDFLIATTARSRKLILKCKKIF